MGSPASKFKNILRDGLIIVALTFILIVVVEAIVRIFFNQEMRVVERNNTPFAMVDSVIGHVYRPNTAEYVTGNEYTAAYEINADGMRDKAFHAIPKPDSVTRILLLGDSFTFGIGVEYDSTWGAIFERECLMRGKRVDVVKAGVSGYDTRQEYLYLQRLYPKYKPDIVLVAFLQNDIVTNLPLAANDSLEGVQSMREDSLTVRGQGAKFSDFQVATVAKRMLLSSDYIYSKLYFSTNRSVYFSSPKNETLRRQVEVTKDLLARMQSYCKEHGAKLIVLSIPQEIQVIMKARKYTKDGIDVDYIDGDFSAFAKEQGFVWLSAFPPLLDRYRSNFEDIYYRLDGHLNAKGTKIVGEFLAGAFESPQPPLTRGRETY